MTTTEQSRASGGQRPDGRQINRATALAAYLDLGLKRSMKKLHRSLNTSGWAGTVSLRRLQKWAAEDRWDVIAGVWNDNFNRVCFEIGARLLAEERASRAAARGDAADKGNAVVNSAASLEEAEAGSQAWGNNDPGNVGDDTEDDDEDAEVDDEKYDNEGFDDDADDAELDDDHGIGDGTQDGSLEGEPESMEQNDDFWEDGSDSLAPDEAWDDEDTVDDDGVGDDEDMLGDDHEPEPPCSWLADMVGTNIDEFPEEYRHLWDYRNGVPLRIQVSSGDGYVNFNVLTSHQKRVVVKTRVRSHYR